MSASVRAMHTEEQMHHNGIYESSIQRSRWLKSMPFEHTFRGVSHQQFLQRLVQERELMGTKRAGRLPGFSLAILCGEENSDRFRHSLLSCLYQTGDALRILVCCRSKVLRDRLSRETTDLLKGMGEWGIGWEERIVFCETFGEGVKVKGSGDYLVRARAGDVFHPSLITAMVLELSAQAPPPKVLTCNDTVIDHGRRPRALKFIRKPRSAFYTLLNFNYVSYHFAFHRSLLGGKADLDEELNQGDGHRMLLRYISGGDKEIGAVPQYLFLKDVRNHRLHREADGGDVIASCADCLHALGYQVERLSGSAPYRLVPKPKAKLISVIMSFRDHADATCSAIQSVCDQARGLPIEFILVNNRSNPASVQQVQGVAERFKGVVKQFRILDYDSPFNHSAQSNRAAREAQGDCLFFMNNDARLESRDALRLMTSWAMVPGIATVGARIVDESGRLVSAGISPREDLSLDADLTVQESRDVEYAEYDRETWGNSFACAAVSRKTFRQVGPLDELHFPVGYNDVDFNLRCIREGMTHLYLGTLKCIHSPGRSRRPADESSQRLTLRRRYPELFRDALFHLREESRRMNRSKAFSFGFQMLVVLGILIRRVRSGLAAVTGTGRRGHGP